MITLSAETENEMNTETFKMSAFEVFSDVLKTFKARIAILAQVAFYSCVLAMILFVAMSVYVAFAPYLNWMILGAGVVLVVNYLLTGQVCKICEETTQGIVNAARFFHTKIFLTERKI